LPETSSCLRTIHLSAPVLRSSSQSTLSHLQALLRPKKTSNLSLPSSTTHWLQQQILILTSKILCSLRSTNQKSPALSSCECRMPLSSPQSLGAKSPLGSAGQFTLGLLSAASVSVARNTLVPPSLSCNNSPSNMPARTGSASHDHPLVSSLYPPALIAPSIAPSHATPRPTHNVPLCTISQPPDSRTNESTLSSWLSGSAISVEAITSRTQP